MSAGTYTAPIRPNDEPRSSRWMWALGAIVVLGIGAAIVLTVVPFGAPLADAAPLLAELRDRGRIAVVGGTDLLRLQVEGAQLMSAEDVDGLDAALEGSDEETLEQVLVAAGVGGLLIDGRGAAAPGGDESLRARLRGYARMRTLRGLYLSPSAALYERRRGLTLTDELGSVLVRAARQMLSGSRTPRIRAFPEPLRRTRNVEVLVMLRRGGRARLWRSARGGNIARALITASSVARQRWAEREQAMGGPIDEVLPRMTVQVYLLEEDGTLGERTPAFVERVFEEEHGVAFEHRGSWHYLLPEATAERGEGSSVHAYTELFSDAGLREDSFELHDLRMYRLVAREVGVSLPTRTGLPTRPPGAAPDLPPGLQDAFDALDR